MIDKSKSLQKELIRFLDTLTNFSSDSAQLDALELQREIRKVQNLVVFKVLYLPAAIKLPSRIRIYSERFKQYLTISTHEHKFDKCLTTQDMAIVELEERGYNIVSIGEGQGCMYVMSDTFKPFKD